MITLGIETSCDETALCLLETKGKISDKGNNIEYRVLGNIIHSQINLHREYGGVYPALAKREHIKNLPILFENLKKETKIEENKIDQIAITVGPGLEPALWTGIVFAKEIAERNNISILSVNHMEGHIVSTLFDSIEKSEIFHKLKNMDFPAIAILISGGHTEIIRVNEIGKYEILGRTRDDAMGEAFDKTARMLDLPYPGGPEVSKLAEEARKNKIKLPRPMIYSKDLDFSFSGLKTAILYTLKTIENINDEQKKDLAREFENSVTEVLIKKTEKALEDNECKSIIVGGGVIANLHIRKEFERLSNKYQIPLYLPDRSLTGDNALMIALAGVLGNNTKNPLDISALGNLSL